DVLDVVGDAEGEEGLVAGVDLAAVGGALPLLLEHLRELGAGDLAGVQGVAEGDHRVRLGVGDHAVALTARLVVPELGADAARVHEADDLVLATQAVLLGVPLHGVGGHVARGGVAHAVVALGGGLVADRCVRGADAVLVGGLGVVPRGGEVPGDGADGLGADDGGVLDRGVRDVGDVGDDIGVDAAALALGQRGGHQLGSVDHVPGVVLAEGEGGGAQVGGARAGLDDRALLALLAGNGGVEVVGAVGVAVEDRVDLGGGLLDDLVEDRVGVVRGDAGVGVRAGALVVGGDEDVVLDPGG